MYGIRPALCSHYTSSRLQRLHQYQLEPPPRQMSYLADNEGVYTIKLPFNCPLNWHRYNLHCCSNVT